MLVVRLREDFEDTLEVEIFGDRRGKTCVLGRKAAVGARGRGLHTARRGFVPLKDISYKGGGDVGEDQDLRTWSPETWSALQKRLAASFSPDQGGYVALLPRRDSFHPESTAVSRGIHNVRLRDAVLADVAHAAETASAAASPVHAVYLEVLQHRLDAMLEYLIDYVGFWSGGLGDGSGITPLQVTAEAVLNGVRRAAARFVNEPVQNK